MLETLLRAKTGLFRVRVSVWGIGALLVGLRRRLRGSQIFATPPLARI